MLVLFPLPLDVTNQALFWISPRAARLRDDLKTSLFAVPRTLTLAGFSE